jgi:two-component system response regulator AtoC
MYILDRYIVGKSRPIQELKLLIQQVADTDLNVLIRGESGVGKELVAEGLHLASFRKNKPFVKVNCAAIPGELLESELFGYERGAFTGADKMKQGKFEIAHGGTILLDEIGDMPLPLQSKMLQVLQDLKFSHLGGKKDISVDCWVLAATNHDLEREIEQGIFRNDLYYRLNIIQVVIPPLRERPEDIDMLINHFVNQFSERSGKQSFTFTDEALDFLRHYSWPGNVRELKNVVLRLLLLGDWPAVREQLQDRENRGIESSASLGPGSAVPAQEKAEPVQPNKCFPPLKEVRKRAIYKAEREVINAVLNEVGWNRKRAADILQISYKALLYKIKDLDLDRNG